MLLIDSKYRHEVSSLLGAFGTAGRCYSSYAWPRRTNDEGDTNNSFTRTKSTLKLETMLGRGAGPADTRGVPSVYGALPDNA